MVFGLFIEIEEFMSFSFNLTVYLFTLVSTPVVSKEEQAASRGNLEAFAKLVSGMLPKFVQAAQVCFHLLFFFFPYSL